MKRAFAEGRDHRTWARLTAAQKRLLLLLCERGFHTLIGGVTFRSADKLRQFGLAKYHGRDRFPGNWFLFTATKRGWAVAKAGT